MMRDSMDATLSPVMSEQAFALWGSDDVAYVRKVTVNGEPAWVISAADGTTLWATPDRDVAFAICAQHDRIGLSVH